MVIICYECKQLCMAARALLAVFEKANVLMKRIHITCNRMYTEIGRDGDVAERARRLTLIRIPGSIWPTVTL